MSGDSVRDVRWCICCQSHHQEGPYHGKQRPSYDEMAEAILAWSDELLPVLQEGGASIPEYVANLHRTAKRLRAIDKEQA